MSEQLSGIAGLADRYEIFIFDLWGVLHNGIAAYPDALDCLSRLRQRGRKVALLSNAPRPGSVVAGEMARLGIEPGLYDTLLTSGDAAIIGYNADRRTAGRPYFHLGPERNQATVAGCNGEERPLEEAREHGVSIGNVDGRILRSATAPRERPKDVAQTKEAPVDGTGFPKARVAGARLRRARPICPF